MKSLKELIGDFSFFGFREFIGYLAVLFLFLLGWGLVLLGLGVFDGSNEYRLLSGDTFWRGLVVVVLGAVHVCGTWTAVTTGAADYSKKLLNLVRSWKKGKRT